MQRLFIDDVDRTTRIDMWVASLVGLLVSYLLSTIALMATLGLTGWDLAGALVVAVALPVVLGLGLFWLIQPARDRR